MTWSTSGPQRCAYCGGVGARTIVALGWSHKRCLPDTRKRKYKGPPAYVKREPAFTDHNEQEPNDG